MSQAGPEGNPGESARAATAEWRRAAADAQLLRVQGSLGALSGLEAFEGFEGFKLQRCGFKGLEFGR